MFTKDSFKNMPKFVEFDYWFLFESIDHVSIFKLDHNDDGDVSFDINTPYLSNIKIADTSVEDVKHLELSSDYPEDFAEAINNAWMLFRFRPEFSIILTSDYNSVLETQYESKLVGYRFIKEFRSGKNPDSVFDRVNRCLEWLRSTDFYTCPASTQYHDSCPSGLLVHTLRVCNRTLELLDCSAFKNIVNVEDAIFVALVHDWCKIGLYQPYSKNVKDPNTGTWVAVEAYKYNDDRAICLGHGVSSMYLAMKFFNISIEVAAAIRHHMSVWNCPQPEFNELQQANRNYPLVHLIQFADQLSIVNY